MEKGVSRYWTPETEEHYKRVLASCLTYAQRDLVMGVRDLLKYDLRTKAGRRALAREQLRIAVATDEDLEEMASYVVVAENNKGIEKSMTVSDFLPLQEAEVNKFKKLRAKIRERGIGESELECQ